MSSCLTEIDDEVLEEAAEALYYGLSCFVMEVPAIEIQPSFKAAPAVTRELYRDLAMTVIESLRRNFE